MEGRKGEGMGTKGKGGHGLPFKGKDSLFNIPWDEVPQSISIKWEPPSWQVIGDLAIDQLKRGHTSYALEVVPMMVAKLVLLEQYQDKDGRLHLALSSHAKGSHVPVEFTWHSRDE